MSEWLQLARKINIEKLRQIWDSHFFPFIYLWYCLIRLAERDRAEQHTYIGSAQAQSLKCNLIRMMKGTKMDRTVDARFSCSCSISILISCWARSPFIFHLNAFLVNDVWKTAVWDDNVEFDLVQRKKIFLVVSTQMEPGSQRKYFAFFHGHTHTHTHTYYGKKNNAWNEFNETVIIISKFRWKGYEKFSEHMDIIRHKLHRYFAVIGGIFLVGYHNKVAANRFEHGAKRLAE